MVSTNSSPSEELSSAARPANCSRRLLRHIVVNHDLMPGSRVLEIGCGQGDLTRQLYGLSLEVTAYERDATALKLAMKQSPQVEFHHWKNDLQRIGGEHPFDLVIAHGSEFLNGDLFSSATLDWTVNLLSNLRPGGSLLFLVRHDPVEWQEPQGHLPSCYSRLLSRFPGSTSRGMFPDALTDRRTWAWLLGRQPRSGFLAASLHTPAQPLSRFEWHQRIARETSRPQEPCCAWARRQTPVEHHIRRAA